MTRAALLDFDGSLRPGFMMVDFGRFLADIINGYSSTVTQLDQLVYRYEGGELSYSELAELVPREFASGLAGIEVTVLERAAVCFVRQDLRSGAIYPHTWLLISELRRVALDPIVISGVPSVLLSVLEHHLGLRQCHGVDLAVAGTRITGDVLRNPARRDDKAAIVDRLGSTHDCRLAVGDSGADEPLFSACDFGIVVGTNREIWARLETLHINPAEQLTQATVGSVERLVEKAAGL